MPLVRPEVFPHTFFDLYQLLGLDKMEMDVEFAGRVSDVVARLEDIRRWLEDKNGTSVSRINTLRYAYTAEQVDAALFGSGADGTTLSLGTSAAKRPVFDHELTSITIADNIEMAGAILRCSGTMTFADGVTISSNGYSTRGIGALDLLSGDPSTGQGGLWSGGIGATAVLGVFTDAADIQAAGGGNGGAAAVGTANSNRGGTVRYGAPMAGLLDNYETLSLNKVGGGAGGGAFYLGGSGETYWGGNGAGVVCLFARTMELASGYTQNFRARGASGNGGGSNRSVGGGGGGTIVLIARNFLPDKAAFIARCSVTGGLGLNGGNNGRPGRIVCLTTSDLGLS